MVRLRVLVFVGLVACGATLAAADRAPIYTLSLVDGIIHPVTSEFMRSAIARADAEGAALIVFTLHTPGGLLDSTRDINNAIIAAKTPVAVFVGPAGYRAASAGFLITITADVAAMAPGTHIGAAHPVAGNGEKIDEVMAKKMASDTAAYALLLAFFALQVLPVSYAGVLLIMLGFMLLVLEVKVTSHGVLGVGGIASLLFGSLMLFDSPLPEMQIGLRLILPVTLTLAGILLFLVRLGVQAQRRPAVTG